MITVIKIESILLKSKIKIKNIKDYKSKHYNLNQKY